MRYGARLPISCEPGTGNQEQDTGTAGTGDRKQEAGNEVDMRGVLRIGQDIAQRLEALGASTLGIVRSLPTGTQFKHVGQQLARAGTSCGANYEEARGAESRADFIHKVSLAAKEARETVYWLRVLRIVNTSDELERTLDEACQLAAILRASARTARRNAEG